MSAMSDLMIDIQELREQGFNDVQIARMLNISLSMIPEQEDEVVGYDDLVFNP